MTRNPVRLVKDDKGIAIRFHCLDESGQPVDLTQFEVDFFLYDGDTLLNENATNCIKPDSALGIAQYTLTATDSQKVGIFHGRLRLQNSVSTISSLDKVILEVASPGQANGIQAG